MSPIRAGLAVLLVFLATAAGAQPPAPASGFSASLDVQVAEVEVLVTDRDGKPVPGLTRDDFQVREDGRPRPGGGPGNPLAKVLDGARTFFAGLGPLDQAKLLLFSDHVRLETPFTSVQPVLTLGLRGVAAEGGTALNDALYLAVKRLESRRGRKIAVLLSDGVDVESVLSIGETRALARRQITLYWLRLASGPPGRKMLFTSAWRDAPEHERELEQLRAAVLESGGRILDLASVEEIPATFTGLLRELRDQYVLGIVPRHTGGKGAWHEVRVEVRDGLKARTQDGYFEP